MKVFKALYVYIFDSRYVPLQAFVWLWKLCVQLTSWHNQKHYKKQKDLFNIEELKNEHQKQVT